jgi:hypothetical protein
MEEKVIQKSKKDAVTLSIYFGITILSMLVIFIGINTFINATSWYKYVEGVFFVIIGFFTPLVLLYGTLTTRYIFGDKTLVLKSGMLKSEFEYANIFVIKDSKRFFAMYSLSMERLELTIKDPGASNKPWMHYFVSPVDKDAFIAELRKHCKHLKVVRADFSKGKK